MSCTQTIFKCKTFHVGSLKYLSSISFGFFHPDNVEDPLSDNSRISSIITVCTIVTGCVLLRHAGHCNRGDKCAFKHNLTYLQVPGLCKERIDISHPNGAVVLTIYPKQFAVDSPVCFLRVFCLVFACILCCASGCQRYPADVLRSTITFKCKTCIPRMAYGMVNFGKIRHMYLIQPKLIFERTVCKRKHARTQTRTICTNLCKGQRKK